MNIPERPVYEEDQVVTIYDLDKIAKHYRILEVAFVQNNEPEIASECCHAHFILEQLAKWVREGKPEGGLTGGKDSFDS